MEDGSVRGATIDVYERLLLDTIPMFYLFLARILLSILSILLVAYVVPGVSVDGFVTAFVVALVLGIINVTLKPILFILTLPITILTLGLFTFVLNACLLWFVARFIEGFEVRSFFAALLGSIIISLTTWAGHRLLDTH